MKQLTRALLSTAALLAVFPSRAYALSDIYFGSIDTYPIVVELQRDGEALSGWYFYRAHAKLIQLSGSMGRDGSFRLDELSSGKKTAAFEGHSKDGQWQGNWHAANNAAAPLSFTFKPADAQANALDGSYACTGKRHDSTANGQYQSDLRWNLKLAVAAGRVRAFSAKQTTRMDTLVEQGCSINLGDVRQQPAAVGVLLKAQGDSDDDQAHDCTVRVIANADTAIVKFGSDGTGGDDCRGLGATMFCSARGGWADMVLDRKNNTCKALQ